MLKLNLVIAVGFLALLTEVSTKCLECSADSNALCINATAFEVCFTVAGVLKKSGIIASCNEGQVCTTQAGICKDPSPLVTPDCPATIGCSTCKGSFACVSQTEFALCANDMPTETILPCPTKTVCDINTAELCATTCSSDPTCSNAVAKLPDPAVDYADTCKGKIMGYYTNVYDATCKTYVLCEEYDKEMKSILYSCPAKEYFDATKTKCVTTLPAGCQV